MPDSSVLIISLLFVLLAFGARRENELTAGSILNPEIDGAEQFDLTKIKCSNLPDVNRTINTGKIDPYFVVGFQNEIGKQMMLSSGKPTFETSHMANNDAPDWNTKEALNWVGPFEPPLRATRLVLNLWDANMLQSNRLVGTLTIPFRKLYMEDFLKKNTNPLTRLTSEFADKPPATHTLGDVAVSCEKTFSSLCEASLPVCSIGYTWKPKLPKLVIKEIECFDLPDTDLSPGGGTIDPFVQVQLGIDSQGEPKTARTETNQDEENPEFKQFHYEFDISDTTPPEVTFTLFDDDSRFFFNKNEEVASAKIELKKLSQNVWRHYVGAFLSANGEVRGKLLFRYLYVTEDRVIYHPTKIEKKNPKK
eukprot:TRINITY_DN49529_c0_g1_i1.p1 TRINITY_DN49529_c0_g1~~TRINITY_DN49529_c0_g1_i1.p1  ORF type:complete len:364 (+),score=40.74 TRINITY_DN49529_c0_g1_i1:67-1158(+)